MPEVKQHESHQEHMNAINTLYGCDAVKTLQRLLTFPAVSHILHLATRLVISLPLQSQYCQNFLLWCSCNTADLVVQTQQDQFPEG